MRPEIEYRLYSKFINVIKTENGVEITHHFDSKNNKLIYKVNSKGQPYTKRALSAYIDESIYEFHNMLGNKELETHSEGIFMNYRIDCKDMFLGKLKEETENVLSNIDVLKLVVWDFETKSYVEKSFHVKHVDFKYGEDNNYNGTVLINYVEPNLTYEDLDNFTRRDALLEYKKFQERGRFDESELNYGMIDELISKYPSFCEHYNMYNMTITQFVL